MVLHQYINSRNRIDFAGETDSNFHHETSHIPLNFKKVVVLQASFPKTYYLVRKGNSLTLHEGTLSADISLIPGIYNSNSLTYALTEAFNEASKSMYQTVYRVYVREIGHHVEVETGKWYYQAQRSNSGMGQPIWISFTNSLFEQLGFDPYSDNYFIDDTNSSNITTLQSKNVCNLNIESTLFIRSDICQNESGDNILQKIYTGGNVSNSIIVFENKSPKYYAKPFNNKGTVFHFTITDEDGNIINTNGCNIQFTLGFW